MILMNTFFGEVKNSYNMNMISIYILVVIVLFIICVVISQKLNIYNSRMNKGIKTTFNTTNESQIQAFDEAASTEEDIRGAEDEQ